ncbi:MAG: hypothetical protein OEV42_10740 [Deltaproteobacteria bacterium]|nr:hypothetical protein [Deltaproteobacteria bacterium]
MEENWKEISGITLIAWLVAYGLFMAHAITDRDGFLLLDHVNLPFHEAGHIFFTPLGQTMHFWGGTIFQLLVPVALMVSFWKKRETAGFAFCLFWLGENFINIARYMADARDLSLPLAGGGVHDWNYILADLGLLHKEKAIAGIVKFMGWIIMISAPLWLLVRAKEANIE